MCPFIRWCVALAAAVLVHLPFVLRAADDPTAWPASTRESRPWAYNWWMGSAVDKENLARELRRYREAGLGGIHVIPIYGAKGAESRYLPFLGSNWMAMLRFAIEEGERLDLGVDMTTGTGWCFGGPWVSTNDAASVFDPVAFKAHAQVLLKPGIRVKRAAPGGEGYMVDPFSPRAMDRYLEPFTRVFDAPGAPKPRAMYHDSFEYRADWTPNLLAEFERRRGYRLQDERDALFATVVNDRAKRIRADYRETMAELTLETFARWTAWCRKRGILTRNEAHGSPGNWLDLYALADIPETEMFGRGTRSATASGFDGARFGEGDRDPLVSKFASSAAHLAGRPRVASESCTWMAEHFCETLEEAKCFMDRLFVSGVNHAFYHGCIYSPDDAAWPGWLFYASTQMNPRNSIWHDAPALNAYIARVQAVLQSGQPDNDVLLYWPLYDYWHHAGGLAANMTVHSRDWLHREAIGASARWLWDHGYGFDYVSDRLLLLTEPGADGTVTARGGAAYRVVVVPAVEHMPPDTVKHMVRLARNGATVIFDQRLPTDVPGFKNVETRRADLKAAFSGLKFESAPGGVQRAALYQGQVLVGPLQACMASSPAAREPIADTADVFMIRRRHETGRHYFFANQGTNTVDGWVALGTAAQSAVLMDPLSGRTGWAETRGEGGRMEVRMRLEPGASLIVRTFADRPAAGAAWTPAAPGAVATAVKGPWNVEFISGGPVLPKAYKAAAAASWTANGDPDAVRFAGTAVYRTTFDAPAAKPGAASLLDLGTVCQSARVRLNGRDLGTLLMKPYRVDIPAGVLKPAGNALEVEVTNLSANRLRDLDRRGVEWRVFTDINIVGIDYKPLDCTKWPTFDSGLLGPVRILEAR